MRLLGRELARGGVLGVLHLLAGLAVLWWRVLEWLLSLLLGSSVLALCLEWDWGAVGGRLAGGELGAVGVVGGRGWRVGTDGDVVGACLGEFRVLGEAVGIGVALAQAADEGNNEEDDHAGEDDDEGVSVGEA